MTTLSSYQGSTDQSWQLWFHTKVPLINHDNSDFIPRFHWLIMTTLISYQGSTDESWQLWFHTKVPLINHDNSDFIPRFHWSIMTTLISCQTFHWSIMTPLISNHGSTDQSWQLWFHVKRSIDQSWQLWFHTKVPLINHGTSDFMSNNIRLDSIDVHLFINDKRVYRIWRYTMQEYNYIGVSDKFIWNSLPGLTCIQIHGIRVSFIKILVY